MCGIAGFSLKASSTVNARQLAHALLTQIEFRGSDASGYAYATRRGMGYHKDHVRGSQLPLRDLPRDAKTVILHTRFATQGAVTDNTNNHPVISPDGNVAITHNGVISNDDELRAGPLQGMDLPDVDSSVIAGLLQDGTADDFRKMAGYAAIAWLRKGQGDILHLARLKNSPVTWTMLADGSIVYASTASLLRAALRNAGLWHGGLLELQEREYVTIEHGIITNMVDLPYMAAARYDVYSRYSNATSGGHGTSRATGATSTAKKAVEIPRPQSRPSEDGGGIGSTFGVREEEPTSDADWNWEDDEAWKEYFGVITVPEVENSNVEDEFDGVERYYTQDTGGAIQGYKTLDALENSLKWYSGLTGHEDFFQAEGLARWVEWFIDVGEVDASTGDMKSWVSRPELTYQAEDPDADSLGYIREGAGILNKLKGA